MSVAFSTQELHPRDRIPFWVDVATKEFFTHGFSAREQTFVGELHAGELENISLAHCVCGPCEVTRTPRDVARDDLDELILCVPLSGRSVMAQCDREVIVEPGMMILQDCSRPLKVTCLVPTTSIFVSIPRNVLEARMGNSAVALASTSSAAPVAGLATGFLTMLTARIDCIEAPVRGRLVEQALDLIALSFCADANDAARTLSSPRATALLRLKAAIDARLSDPDLKPTAAAAAAGISVRYANDLLSGEDFSVERYILHRRLERCRSALADPLQAHRMIGEIAFRWGFSDHSHFTRRFREAFGMTPGDCRRRAQEQPL